MKKIILIMVMMLVASVSYGKKYKENVASQIIMTVNTKGIGIKGASEFICNLRKNGIKPHVRVKMSSEEDWMVKIGDNEFKTLDEAGVTECFALLYDKLEKKNDEKGYKIDEKCDDVYAIQEKYDGSYRGVRERDYMAEGAWKFSMFRLTGNPTWLSW